MHTNKTTHYELPQYVGSDIINPLTDTNGAYSAIDTALHNIASAQAEDATNITAIETKVGDDALTTTAQDISGAVNELDAELETADIGVKARLTTVENDTAALQTKMGTATLNTTAQNVSDAINELDNDIVNGSTGLNKRVTDLETAVGNSDAGLIHDVSALKDEHKLVANIDVTTETFVQALTTLADQIKAAGLSEKALSRVKLIVGTENSSKDILSLIRFNDSVGYYRFVKSDSDTALAYEARVTGSASPSNAYSVVLSTGVGTDIGSTVSAQSWNVYI